MAQAGLKHDPDVGIQHDATMQLLLRRRSGPQSDNKTARKSTDPAYMKKLEQQ